MMFDAATLADTPPFGLTQGRKMEMFHRAMAELTRHHYGACPEYRSIVDKMGFAPASGHSVADYPFLPVRLFKDNALKSIPDDAVIKTMTSSGTTGQNVSKIFLDRTNATIQTKVLTRIVCDFIGSKRLPMLVIDSKSTVRDRTSFSARGAGILGFSMFGRDVTYALDDDMNIDFDAVSAFVEKHRGETVLMFGFTYIVYQCLLTALRERSQRLPLADAILIHGGGWKKLADQAIGNDEFKEQLRDLAGVTRVHNYYGMVEQTGSIFMECEAGHLHSSIYSDIVIRGNDLKPLGMNQPGLVELASLLPTSYPGHILLTEDIGEWLGEDDCKCDRMGKYFRIHGRAKKAEVRGCSDTFSAN